MKRSEAEEKIAWPNLKEKLALVPTEPGISWSMALLHLFYYFSPLSGFPSTIQKVHLNPSILNNLNPKLVIKTNLFELWTSVSPIADETHNS